MALLYTALACVELFGVGVWLCRLDAVHKGEGGFGAVERACIWCCFQLCRESFFEWMDSACVAWQGGADQQCSLTVRRSGGGDTIVSFNQLDPPSFGLVVVFQACVHVRMT